MAELRNYFMMNLFNYGPVSNVRLYHTHIQYNFTYQKVLVKHSAANRLL